MMDNAQGFAAGGDISPALKTLFSPKSTSTQAILPAAEFPYLVLVTGLTGAQKVTVSQMLTYAYTRTAGSGSSQFTETVSQQTGPYLPNAATVALSVQRTILALPAGVEYQLDLTPAALGTAVVTATLYRGKVALPAGLFFPPSIGGGGGAVTSVAGRVGDVTLVPADVSLGNVDNVSDANKPVSTAQATADTAVATAASSALGAHASAANPHSGSAPKGAVGASGLTMTTARLLGRSTAATGAVEEITSGTNLTLAAGILNAAENGITTAGQMVLRSDDATGAAYKIFTPNHTSPTILFQNSDRAVTITPNYRTMQIFGRWESNGNFDGGTSAPSTAFHATNSNGVTIFFSLGGRYLEPGIMVLGGAPSANTGAALEFIGMTAPAAPPGSGIRLYAEPTAGSKTRIMAKFASGAVTCIGVDGGVAHNNQFLGDSAGASLTSGSDNTGIGFSSLGSVTTAQRNTALGVFTLVSNISGNYNTAQGFSALSELGAAQTAGAFVVGVSYTIVSVGTTNFVAIGAASNTVGVVFVATGVGSGTGTATPNNTSNNTAIGYNTGRGIITGSGNTIIGANVTGLSPSLTNTVIIADGVGNQRIVADSSGNVGIGMTPAQKLDVTGNIQSTGYQRTAPVTVATLTAAATAGAGARHAVTDSTVATTGNVGSTVVGGGANTVSVFCTGAAWIIC